jgi:hypothetical protein
LSGTLWIGPYNEFTRKLTLTYKGGPHDGEILILGYRDGE